MDVSETSLILRYHVIERRMRSSIKSVCLDGDTASSVPRMSEAEFQRSCALTRGVPEQTLQILEIWVCESAGSTWTVDAVMIQGKLRNIPLNQIALRLTLAQAAERAGFPMDHIQARKAYREALGIVRDNLVAKVRRRKHAAEA